MLKNSHPTGEMSHEEIAKLLGLSRSRVQQLERSALAKLRRAWLLSKLDNPLAGDGERR